MELQRLQALLQPTFTQTAPAGKPGDAASPDFGQVLQQAIQQVEQDQQTAADAATQLVTGQTTDIAGVMVASQRASLSLGLALQVRNKVLEAYQEIMRMPL